MNMNLVLGTFVFALLAMVVSAAAQFALELLGATPALAGHIGMYLVAIPIALFAARRVGHVTRLSVLVASLALAVAGLWFLVFTLNSVAEPVGGHFGWLNLFNAMNWRYTVFGSAAMLVVPQLWLLLFNHLAANNSFKPNPLRGSA